MLNKKDLVEANDAEVAFNEKHILRSVNRPSIMKLLSTYKYSRHIYFMLTFINGGNMFNNIR